MVTVTIGNNVKKQDKVLEPSTTLRAAFEMVGIKYAEGVSTLDGAALNAGDIDKTFAEMNVTGHCFLYNVAKADNAA
jgi:hypothetical protein